MKPRHLAVLLAIALSPSNSTADEANLVFSFAWGGPYPIACYPTPTPTARFGLVNSVAADAAGNVYTSEQGSGCARYDADRIQKFDNAGNFQTSWWTSTVVRLPEYLSSIPVAVAVHPSSGEMYVSEGGDLTGVQIFTPDGLLVGSLGARGAGDGQYQNPGGLAISPDGSVFVADLTTHRVLKFDADDRFVGWAGKCTAGSGCDTGGGRSLGFSCTASTCSGSGPGTGAGQFYYPVHLALGPSGDLYVSDNSSRIQKFDASGAFVLQWGRLGNSEGNPDGDTVLNNPYGIAVTPSGNVYVADSGNSRIVKYDGDGTFLGWAGSCYGGPNCVMPGYRSDGFSCSAATCTAGTFSSYPGTISRASHWPISPLIASRGTLTILSTMTWETVLRPVLVPGGRPSLNSGASTQSDVMGQTVTLAWVGSKRSDWTTRAGRGLPV